MMITNLKHGGALGGRETPEYSAWKNMLRRCYTQTNPRYASYGGRGITVCERWQHSYANFLADMGPRPSRKHSLDRRDNDGNYDPGNCRWALPVQQQGNLRNSLFAVRHGKRISLAALGNAFGIPRNTLRFRILKGWSLTEAVTRPVRFKAPKSINLR